MLFSNKDNFPDFPIKKKVAVITKAAKTDKPKNPKLLNVRYVKRSVAQDELFHLKSGIRAEKVFSRSIDLFSKKYCPYFKCHPKSGSSEEKREAIKIDSKRRNVRTKEIILSLSFIKHIINGFLEIYHRGRTG